MTHQGPTAAQAKGAAQRSSGARGSTTLTHQQTSNTKNNNANSLIEQAGERQANNVRTFSQNRHAGVKHQQDGGGATAASGGYLRPKVLDF
eukprot:CAMPEP_0170450542 /NCGR_PEP_ID=MMETSP0123-20130129/41_1 /TAXON_ID=182087 /ORGANISM="Favella ehrenbergii, Strain Fehren 1" /LENGTH=90 /DNA_ID=CAMNT_0010711853 /DNA_START=1030 /DNA_END=1302 /DNA_ORIENTATION=-